MTLPLVTAAPSLAAPTAVIVRLLSVSTSLSSALMVTAVSSGVVAVSSFASGASFTVKPALNVPLPKALVQTTSYTPGVSAAETLPVIVLLSTTTALLRLKPPTVQVALLSKLAPWMVTAVAWVSYPLSGVMLAIVGKTTDKSGTAKDTVCVS